MVSRKKTPKNTIFCHSKDFFRQKITICDNVSMGQKWWCKTNNQQRIYVVPMCNKESYVIYVVPIVPMCNKESVVIYVVPIVPMCNKESVVIYVVPIVPMCNKESVVIYVVPIVPLVSLLCRSPNSHTSPILFVMVPLSFPYASSIQSLTLFILQKLAKQRLYKLYLCECPKFWKSFFNDCQRKAWWPSPKTQAIFNIGCTPQQPSNRNHT